MPGSEHLATGIYRCEIKSSALHLKRARLQAINDSPLLSVHAAGLVGHLVVKLRFEMLTATLRLQTSHWGIKASSYDFT
jgi:hypothetical protein